MVHQGIPDNSVLQRPKYSKQLQFLHYSDQEHNSFRTEVSLITAHLEHSKLCFDFVCTCHVLKYSKLYFQYVHITYDYVLFSLTVKAHIAMLKQVLHD